MGCWGESVSPDKGKGSSFHSSLGFSALPLGQGQLVSEAGWDWNGSVPAPYVCLLQVWLLGLAQLVLRVCDGANNGPGCEYLPLRDLFKDIHNYAVMWGPVSRKELPGFLSTYVSFHKCPLHKIKGQLTRYSAVMNKATTGSCCSVCLLFIIFPQHKKTWLVLGLSQ